MAEAGASAPDKDRLLSLGVHEFRTPVTVIAGYLRMLMTGRGSPLNDNQRTMLEAMEKSTARLSALIAQMSELSVLEAGGATLNLGGVDIGALLASEIAALPPLPDREITVAFKNEAAGAKVLGDPVRLRTTMASLLIAHRRELVTTSELCVWLRRTTRDGRPTIQMTIGGADRIAQLQDVGPAGLAPFEEFRGGIGFTLPIARRIVQAHKGELWSPAENPHAGAVLFLPEA